MNSDFTLTETWLTPIIDDNKLCPLFNNFNISRPDLALNLTTLKQLTYLRGISDHMNLHTKFTINFEKKKWKTLQDHCTLKQGNYHAINT